MRLKSVTLENVRSFLEPTTIPLAGDLAIIVGPNGGGKTNFLDALVITARKYLSADLYPEPTPTNQDKGLHEFRTYGANSSLAIEKHSRGADLRQQVVLEYEVSQPDVENIRSIKDTARTLIESAKRKYRNLEHVYGQFLLLPADALEAGQPFTLTATDTNASPTGPNAELVLAYLKLFETDARLRAEYGVGHLSMPFLFLPTTRTAQSFQSSVQLVNYNENDFRKQLGITHTRTGGYPAIPLAVGKLARTFRELLELDTGDARARFHSDENLQGLTKVLRDLGYDWSLACTNPLTNEYEVQLTKQGSSFLVSHASAGERELLTYLFAIYVLNLRDALILVDEPELHLHPQWQRTLVRLFGDLAGQTGNQFVLATHSPAFISPQSIGQVTRVYSKDQQSKAQRLDATGLPNAKHLFQIVNSQNNERIFFADLVILVEGVIDRLVVDRILSTLQQASRQVIEIVSVGGKGLFQAYGQLLNACQIPYAIIADLDYIEQLGGKALHNTLFEIDANEIRKDVIENDKSRDGQALVDAIESALTSESVAPLSSVWNYIRSHRKRLRDDLKHSERAPLVKFIHAQYAKRIYVLKRGQIEDYLPAGFRTKDVERILALVARDDFMTSLPAPAGRELRKILGTLVHPAT